MKDFRKIQQQDLKLQIIDELHPKRILAEKYISDRYNSAFNAQLNSFMSSYMALMQGEQVKSKGVYSSYTRVIDGEAYGLTRPRHK